MMSLENAFIEQLAQYIEINYKEYLPVTDENILYEKYAPFVDIPERKELTRDQSMDLQHLLDEAGDSFHEKLFELIDKSGMSDVEVYKRACIDRRLFSKIRSNPAYHPGKSTVLALVFALKLDIKAARDLLASLYTGMLTTAMTVNRRIHKGKISIFDIHEEVLAIAKAWNKNNPNKMQHPIYRGRIGGTIYFEVEKYTSYETLQVYLKAENYTIRNVEPLSSRKEKRLAVFVMISEKYCAEKQLALITKEIVSYVRNLNVFSTAVSETKFKNMSARAVWCYFGHDESDMVNHRYFARSIWACDRSGKKKYYSEQKNSSIIRGIWVTTDSFYESVRRLQQSELTREEFESGIQKTLCQTTSLAERYIADIREIDNQTKTISEIRETYREWIRQVYEEYFKMTEIPTVPDDLHDRFNIVEDLAGCVLDMALLLNKDEEYTDGNQWLIKNNIRKYYEGLEKLKIIDEKGR